LYRGEMKITTVNWMWVWFGILILSLTLTGFLLDRNIGSIGRVVDTAVEEPTAAVAYEMEINVIGTGLGVLKYLETGDPQHHARVRDDADDFKRYKAQYDRLAETEHDTQFGEQIGALYEQYKAVGDTLMNTKDEQSALLAQVGECFEKVDEILDERIQPNTNRRELQGLQKVEVAANMEADAAEMGTWLGHYLQTHKAEYKERIFDNANDFLEHLAQFRTLHLTEETTRWAGELEAIFNRTMSQITRALELNGSLREDQKRFINLRTELDTILDEKIQVATFNDMEAAKAEARQRVKYLHMASLALLGIGLTITCGATAIIARRSTQLEKSNRELQMRIVEREQAEGQLRASREQLRALSAHLQSVREEERTRIAREIHDELGQLVTGMIIDLSWLEEKLSRANGATSLRPAVRKVQSILQLADTTVDTVRRIATELRSGLLDDFGLVAAVEWQAQDFQTRTGIECDFVANLDETDFEPAYSTAVFRIFQEALTNVARHAEASSVSIALEENGGKLTLQVEDNGKGVMEDVLSNTRSLGVLGMRERALILGGEVEIKNVCEKGTRVTARIPLPDSGERRAGV
jgi:signal transduction histidine kinase